MPTTRGQKDQAAGASTTAPQGVASSTTTKPGKGRARSSLTRQEEAPSRPPPPTDVAPAADERAEEEEVSEPQIISRSTITGIATARTGILKTMFTRFTKPIPALYPQMIQVNSINYIYYFRAVYVAIIDALYPDGSYPLTGVISQDDFVKVCRYLLKSRVDQVYSAATGRRPTGRIAIPREVEIPKSISDVINAIGVYTINHGALTCIPEPEAQPADQTTALHTAVSFNMLRSFSGLVQEASSFGHIRTGFISSVTTGTAFWLLAATKPTTDGTVADGTTENIEVYGTFDEWTPVDGLLCAIVQNQFSGLFPDIYPKALWSFDRVRGSLKLRAAFALNA